MALETGFARENRQIRGGRWLDRLVRPVGILPDVSRGVRVSVIFLCLSNRARLNQDLNYHGGTGWRDADSIRQTVAPDREFRFPGICRRFGEGPNDSESLALMVGPKLIVDRTLARTESLPDFCDRSGPSAVKFFHVLFQRRANVGRVGSVMSLSYFPRLLEAKLVDDSWNARDRNCRTCFAQPAGAVR